LLLLLLLLLNPLSQILPPQNEIPLTDPAPAALTQQELSTILSNTSVHERAAAAFNTSHRLATINRNDPGLITMAFEQFQICTNNIRILQPQDASEKH